MARTIEKIPSLHISVFICIAGWSGEGWPPGNGPRIEKLMFQYYLHQPPLPNIEINSTIDDKETLINKKKNFVKALEAVVPNSTTFATIHWLFLASPFKKSVNLRFDLTTKKYD